jgi:predicted glycosyltransferase involved in capsule biosynthesis
MHKLGIIVPYRDRDKQLLIFKKFISNYLSGKNIDYELIVVEQDGAKTFNRGKLLNIGFIYSKKLNCDYVVFHDIDMLPIDVDYSYSPHPVQLSTKFISEDPTFNRIVFDEYFGGVTLFPTNIFETINGYPNEYWGWGYEDNDLLFRCRQYNVDLYEKKIKLLGSNSAALKFNGKSAYVKTNNVFDFAYYY